MPRTTEQMSTGTQPNTTWAHPDSRANLTAPAGGVNPRPGPLRRRGPKPIPPRPLTWRGHLVVAHYWAVYWVLKFVRWHTLRVHTINPQAVDRAGPFVLACTHLSHVEPALLGVGIRRKIDWVARIEFYRYRVARWLLDAVDCFPVNRGGVPVSTIRDAIARLNAGRVVGIFPEGGVVKGADFVGRGGPIRGGACVISRRAGVPVIPVVFLGTHVLNAPGPWFPLRAWPPRRTPVYIAYGCPIEPVLDDPCPRRARLKQCDALRAEFVRLYAELREQYGIDDAWVP